MKTLQKGFTLIELMIVVAIIGILAAIAVPAYQDYTIKSRVSEGASLVSAARTAVDVAFAEGTVLGSMPVTHASLGLSNAGSYNSKYVARVSMRASGVVVVSLKNEKTMGPAKGLLLIYQPTNRGGNLQWVATGGANAVATKYRPKS